MSNNAVIKYIDTAKQMPSLIDRLGLLLLDNRKKIVGLYNRDSEKLKKYLDRENTKLLTMARQYKGLKAKHIIARGITEKYPDFKNQFSENESSDDLFNIPVVVLLTGLSGDIITSYETISQTAKKQNEILSRLENGELTEADLNGEAVSPIIKSAVNLPVALGIGGALFTGYYFLTQKR